MRWLAKHPDNAQNPHSGANEQRTLARTPGFANGDFANGEPSLWRVFLASMGCFPVVIPVCSMASLCT
jgi:hypothetical protein